jgi:hypothetical protein
MQRTARTDVAEPRETVCRLQRRPRGIEPIVAGHEEQRRKVSRRCARGASRAGLALAIGCGRVRCPTTDGHGNRHAATGCARVIVDELLARRVRA